MSDTRKLFESIQNNLKEGVEEDNFIKQCEESGKFDDDQMEEIKSGFEDGLSMEQVQVYAKPEFDSNQMIQIEGGLEEGLSMEQIQVYAKPEFNSDQMYYIRDGFKDGLSMEQVQVYAKPEFNSDQMGQIKYSFTDGLSMEQVQVYAKPEFDSNQMRRIRNSFIDRAENPTKYDNSKAYYIMEDGYLQGVTKDEKYYSDDWNTWSCYDAETISEAKAFKKYSTAENFLDKRIDSYSGEERISGLSSDTAIISLNQLLSGEVKTKTDISAVLNKSSKKSTKNKEVNKSVDNGPVDNDEDEEDEDIDDTMTYTMTASDGTKFSYQEEYADPESRSDYEDHDEFWQAIKYCDEHGLDKLTAWEGDREFVWRKDEDGHWKNETTDEYIN